jgi:hypothetical protein
VKAIFYPAQSFDDLIFTEIMYNPPGVGAASGDEFEFLELKNAGTNVLDLTGLGFSAGINFNFTSGTRLSPGQFFVLGRNLTTLAARYPGLTVHGVYTGKLDNGGEQVTISNPLGTKVVSAEYKDGGRWPITPDGLGFSLVPKSPNANPNPDNPSTWRASANRYGSPGADDPEPAIPGIVINEVLTHSEPQVDTIELYNPTDSSVNIGGWFLTDDASVPMKFRIPDNTSIPPGGYLVFTEADFNPTPGTNNSFVLSSQGEEIYLLGGDANTNLTGYSHGFSFGAAENGVSFGRYVLSTGDEHFVAQISITPGETNSGPRVGPVVIRQIMYHPPDLPGVADNSADEYIELHNITTSTVPLFDDNNPPNRWRLRGGVSFDLSSNVSLGATQSILLVNFDPNNAAALAAFRAKYGLFAGLAVHGPYIGKLNNSSDTVELQKPGVPDTNGVPYIAVDKVDYKDSAPWPSSPDGSGAALQRVNIDQYADDPINWVGAAPLTITAQPQTFAVRSGSNVTFSVSAYGTGDLMYQWRQNGVNIAGATNMSISLTNVQMVDDGSYTVAVADLSGSIVSSAGNLLILVNPAILQAPLSQTVVAGGRVTLSVAISGNPPPYNYEWRSGSVPVATNSLNQTAAFYTFTAPNVATSLQYRVVVKNMANPAPGVSHSPLATITVLADTDQDGIPDEWETAYGLAPNSAADAAIDTDGDGMTNLAEYIAGTDPNDAQSYLKVDPMPGSSGSTISFGAISNKTYTVQSKDGLDAAPWQKLADFVAHATNRVEIVADPGPFTNRFYRLVTPRLP